LKTLAARVEPPQRATFDAVAKDSKNSSSGATTTTTSDILVTPANAAKVCITIAWPAKGWYCLGLAVPARDPAPAQGIKPHKRASEQALAGEFLVESVMGVAPF
jgi:hypothetical protein